MLLYICKEKEQQPESEVQIMKLYSALVKDGNRLVEIKNEESRLYDYIIAETNLYPWDWDLKSIPCN